MNLEALREEYDVVPVVRELSADTLTPLLAFEALSRGDGGRAPEAFLFESVERGANVGRYSFIGFDPRRNIRFDASVGEPVRVLEDELVPLRVAGGRTLPPFFGGAVGYFGYGVSGWSEAIPDSHRDDLGIPDAKLLFFDNVVVFDHVMQRLYVVANVFTKDGSLEDADQRLDRAIAKLRRAALEPLAFPAPGERETTAFTANCGREEFEAMVLAAKEEIAAGEIFQVVLSQRWETAFPTGKALTLYRTLRSINPSPYMFLLRTDECTLVGASPEMLVRVTDGVVEARPIAGTRRRGATRVEDLELEQALVADPKENAEHLMLVDLGRNDLGRISASGSVEVLDFRHIERYSHVMHLVTDLRGRLREGCTPVDAFLACFPAGTVSGAPRIRAMELIDRFERTRRGPYAGAVAWFGFSGNLDSCIAIRTIVLAHDRAYIQAGAGIVHDSDPAKEYQETLDKSRALRDAVSMAMDVLRLRAGD